MATRAYRVIKIETEDTPSYSCWENSDLDNFLRDHASWSADGYFEISVSVLEDAIEEFPQYAEALQKDLDEVKRKGEEYVMYSTF